jgi:Mrp family chromosome partitioning ATPase
LDQTATPLDGLARRLTPRGDHGRAVLVAPVSAGAGASTVAAGLARRAALLSGRPAWLYDLDFQSNPQAGRARLNGQAYTGELSGLKFWREEPDGSGRLAMRRCEDAPVFISQFQRNPGAVRRLTFHGAQDYWRQARRASGLVIVDAPFRCAALTTIAPDMDGVILVADAAQSRRSAADSLSERIKEAGGRVLGVVVNRAPAP